MMPGAGEHMEPGKDIIVKAGVLRAINEEIGIAAETIAKSYLLNLGIYSKEGRDPRYWTYSYENENGEKFNFGMERGSTTKAYIIYFDSNSNDEPKEIAPQDTIEVGFKWWAELDTVLSDYDVNRWMILDHMSFIPDAIALLNDFDTKSDSYKEAFRFNI
jgi:hypothetical protein